jgi:hypothetical protein
VKKVFFLSVLILVLASHSSRTQDRSSDKSLVNMGDVMSGLQAGFTDGVIIEPVNTGFNVIDSVEFRVDYVSAESTATKAKLGNLSWPFDDDSLGGIRSWGAFLEPYSPAPGTHTAYIRFHITPETCALFGAPYPCDIQVGPVGFEIIAD